jgi:SAM-dependent methyltransferase
MSGFSKEWNEIYANNQQLTSWPWSDLISLVYRYCITDIDQDGSVLELGFGTGPNIPFFHSIGLEYYGIEGSSDAREKLYKKFPELKEGLIVGDFTKKKSFEGLPEFDIVIDRASLTHNNKKSISDTLINCYDVMKPGGYFIGVDWFSSNHSDFNLGEESVDSFTRTRIEGGQFENVGDVHFSDEKHLRSLFSRFDIIYLEEKIINTYEPKNNHQFASWNIVVKK